MLNQKVAAHFAPPELSKILDAVIYKHFIPTGFIVVHKNPAQNTRSHFLVTQTQGGSRDLSQLQNIA